MTPPTPTRIPTTALFPTMAAALAAALAVALHRMKSGAAEANSPCRDGSQNRFPFAANAASATNAAKALTGIDTLLDGQRVTIVAPRD